VLFALLDEGRSLHHHSREIESNESGGDANADRRQ
jgi:hypothetical protein